MTASHQDEREPQRADEPGGGPLFSVVIPAYNEAERFPPYLRAIRSHLETHFGRRYEVVVVDDGSRDRLADALGETAGEFPQLRVIRHETNRGKGAAVRTGVLAAEGRYVLFADADGATPIGEETRLRALLESGDHVAVGSRILQSDQVKCRRNPVRKWIGRVFADFARKRLGLSVSDPQCGFKMFQRPVARHLFSWMREDGYYFDLEMLILAERFGYRVGEAAVNWEEKPGSRMNFFSALGRFFGAIRRLRRLKRQAIGNSAPGRLS